MRVRVRLFAVLREAAGAAQLELDIDGEPDTVTASDVWSTLEVRCPALAGRRRGLAVAVNRRVVPLTSPVAPGDELAFLPPISGG
jgi:molybdopterin converting factor small subunit